MKSYIWYNTWHAGGILAEPSAFIVAMGNDVIEARQSAVQELQYIIDNIDSPYDKDSKHETQEFLDYVTNNEPDGVIIPTEPYSRLDLNYYD